MGVIGCGHRDETLRQVPPVYQSMHAAAKKPRTEVSTSSHAPSSTPGCLGRIVPLTPRYPAAVAFGRRTICWTQIALLPSRTQDQAPIFPSVSCCSNLRSR
ncbi:predicted protein [Uncinocarpus reesii 1704]|uniref:Uncharacterized protein n=1 Tax=Uncinocarpus reesii (strain UAMH 1704) TaxID=336963 RepID=C4JE43_UNCRE|nr:uncharacterized protein UREG_00467 [Uncinocarpus reesii 1704]EEP75621.1 predicted protein [Uncinocarpus reesii 1704]